MASQMGDGEKCNSLITGPSLAKCGQQLECNQEWVCSVLERIRIGGGVPLRPGEGEDS